jgi:DNA-binding transcriptional LysR family regulator
MILGAIPGATPDKWAARWRQRFPDHALEVKYYDDAGQLERISAGTVDIGYVRFYEHKAQLNTELFHRVLLYREDSVVCAAAEHWIAAADDSVDAADLNDETFLDPAQMLKGSHGSAAGVDADSGSASESLEVHTPRPGADLAGAERMALEVAASGAGVVVLPHSVARMLSRRDVVIRRIAGSAGYETGLAWLRARDSALIQEFIGIARGRKEGSPRSLSSQKPSPKSNRSPGGQKPRSRPGARAGTSGRPRKQRRR